MAHMAASHAASPKAAHYHSQLTAALLRGSWADSKAGAAPNGTDLSWGELIRKWGKHTGGNTALIHSLRDISLLYLSTSSHPSSQPQGSGYISLSQRTSTRENAPDTSTSPQGATYQPGSSNSNSSADETVATEHSASGSSFIHIPHPHRHKNRVSLDGSGPSDSTRTTTNTTNITTSSGGTAIPVSGRRPAYLSATDLDGDDGEYEGYWGDDKGWWAGVGIDQVSEVKEEIKKLEVLISGGKLHPGELSSAKLILGYHLHAIGDFAPSIRMLQSINTADPKSGVLDGDSALLDRTRGACLIGLSIELGSGDHQAAIQAYTSVIPLSRSISGFNPAPPAYLAGTSTSSSAKLPFESHRELIRWLATALTRAAILSARTTDLNQTLRILRTYHAYAESWPSVFRPVQRQRMLSLYLRALQAGFPPPGTTTLSPYLIGFSASSQLPSRQVWRKEVVEAFRYGQQLLSSTTSFPRAGSFNRPVSTFVELCVSLADTHRQLCQSAVNILWWSMTLTFQSQAILRHLTRLLAVSGHPSDARRTFELYVQLVLKARETAQPDVSLQLKRRPTDDAAAHPKEIERQAEEAEWDSGPMAESRKTQIAEAEIDSDTQFIEALLVGARVLLRDLDEAEEAWRYVTLAGDVVDNSLRRNRGKDVSPVLRAEVEECKGIVRMAVAAAVADPILRPTYQSQAINHLKSATELAPTSSTAFYHLSYCLAESRQIQPAISAIRTALELDQKNVQSWHLLALLLTASNDWLGGSKACEAGERTWEDDEALDIGEEDVATSGNPNQGDPAIESKDFAAIPQIPTIETPTAPTSTANAFTLLLPDGSIRHLPETPLHPITRTKKLENVIRLRMSYNIIVEKIEGADIAMLKQQDLFAFFSARSGKNRGSFGYGRALEASMGSMKDLGGSYVSVAGTAPGASTAGASVTGIVLQPATPATEVPTPIPRIVQSSAPSPGDSSPVSDVDHLTPTLQRKKSTQSLKGSARHRKILGRHLQIPTGRIGATSSRPSSIRRMTGDTQSAIDLSIPIAPRQRNTSTSSAVPSIAPTAVHSHFHSHSTSRTPAPPPPAKNTVDHGRTAAESRILSDLWLMSAATFRRWGKLEQCLVAIEEAEILDPENPDVWVQLGLYYTLTSPSTPDLATQSFIKSVLLKPNHPSALVSLSKLYLTTGQVELAHSLLNQMTQEGGWDIPEAWYYLGKVCEAQGGRDERARECYIYALGLEKGRGCRRWDEGVDRWL